MIQTALVSIVSASLITFSSLGISHFEPTKILSEHTMSLEKRQANSWVNSVFKDNILLNMAYLDRTVSSGNNVNWDEVRKPFTYEFTLAPGQVFAFHDSLLPEYKDKQVLTTNAHFNSFEGFKSDGYLVGDGVCHLASLIYWAAEDAGLDAKAPTNHNFAVINEVPKEDGVAIYNQTGSETASALQNLYITNNLNKAVTFKFDFDGSNLKVIVIKES